MEFFGTSPGSATRGWKWRVVFFLMAWLWTGASAPAADALWPDAVTWPEAGRTDLRVLAPDLLELRFIQHRSSWSDPAQPAAWWENQPGPWQVPSAGDWEVTVNGKPVTVSEIGWKRAPVRADPHTFDLLLLGQVFFRLADPLDLGTNTSARRVVEVRPKAVGASAEVWPGPESVEFSAERFSPALHFNRHGFAPEAPKFAFVSYDLGTLGEMDLPTVESAANQTSEANEASEASEPPKARLLDAGGRIVAEAPLEHRPEPLWPWEQKVWRADFSHFTEEGEYQLEVPGLGRSGPWRIFPAAVDRPVRLLAQALYHQRSGEDKGPPYTRFGHPASHLPPAWVPDGSADFAATDRHLAAMSGKNTEEDQIAPRLDRVEAGLYPFVRTGRVPVQGGHHDAGDYSKYTINSAQMIHQLILALDHFPGADRAQFLGLPARQDPGEPDILRIARHEAEFLLRMQDDDGGFYFLVYPRDRPYELDVLPQHGDPQVVFPKNTAATAAATGALAQMAASPAVRRAHPELARQCLQAARRGWQFLERAVAEHGEEGSYQAISHYGNFARHRDEMAFAAAALFTATGEEPFEQALRHWWPDPLDGTDKKWSWWPLFEFYGSAARVLALSEIAKPPAELTPEAQVWRKNLRESFRQAARTWLDLSAADAYGLPVSSASKRQRRAGWFWAMDPAVDVATAWLLFPEKDFRQEIERALALWAGYEAGGNPLNLSFFGGDGPRWRRHVVNRISLNDDRKLAPPGLPIGQRVSSPQNLRPYQQDGRAGLRSAYEPSLASFPLPEISGLDTYNVREEWTVATGARLLAGYLFLSGLAEAEAEGRWIPPSVEITGVPASVPSGTRIEAGLAWPEGPEPGSPWPPEIVWEWIGREPSTGERLQGVADTPGPQRIEVEVVWPDGRRAAAVRAFEVEP